MARAVVKKMAEARVHGAQTRAGVAIKLTMAVKADQITSSV
jgi:hypothetical protein